jgi:ABC-type molybdenum transport system ATPase subunit/photorepair protein PhrA
MALRPQDKVPDWITHIMVVGNSNKVLLQGPRAAIDDTLNVWSYVAKSKQDRDSLPEQQTQILKKCEADLKAGVLDKELLGDLVAHTNPIKTLEVYASLGGEPVIDMEGIRVQYGDKVILGDWKQKVKDQIKDGLHWRVRRGQRWAILGPNGSGKTTLLSMITSDHPQAYGQPVKLFGRSRLPEPGKPGISIFELQSRIGHSSPEIHAFFPRQLSIRQALETAFAETFLSKPKLNIERDLDISAILQYFRPQLDPNYTTSKVANDISAASLPLPSLTKQTHVRLEKYALLDHIVGYADEILFGELTTAQQRIVLFMRALVAKPDIVILDEAFSGLSAAQRNRCLHFLDKGERAKVRASNVSRTEADLRFTGLTEDQALIMTSHVAEEIPDSVRYYMRLPSPAGTPDSLDFRFGILQSKTSLRHPQTWEAAWSPPDVFLEYARRTWRRKQHTLPVQDISEFEWWSI